MPPILVGPLPLFPTTDSAAVIGACHSHGVIAQSKCARQAQVLDVIQRTRNHARMHPSAGARTGVSVGAHIENYIILGISCIKKQNILGINYYQYQIISILVMNLYYKYKVIIFIVEINKINFFTKIYHLQQVFKLMGTNMQTKQVQRHLALCSSSKNKVSLNM